jgi:hypothetical protein
MKGYPLAGGRLDYLENRTVAVRVSRRALHTIDLYVWPAVDNGVSSVHGQTVHGYNVLDGIRSWLSTGIKLAGFKSDEMKAIQTVICLQVG